MSIYKIGSKYIDLAAIVAVEWAGGTCPIVVYCVGGQFYIDVEYLPDDDPSMDLDELCEARHSELIEAWKKHKAPKSKKDIPPPPKPEGPKNSKIGSRFG